MLSLISRTLPLPLMTMLKTLKTYEYASYEIFRITNFVPFMSDFCRIVFNRGLQHKVRLKIESGDDDLD